jgi:hypothetical protein
MAAHKALVVPFARVALRAQRTIEGVTSPELHDAGRGLAAGLVSEALRKLFAHSR